MTAPTASVFAFLSLVVRHSGHLAPFVFSGLVVVSIRYQFLSAVVLVKCCDIVVSLCASWGCSFIYTMTDWFHHAPT